MNLAGISRLAGTTVLGIASAAAAFFAGTPECRAVPPRIVSATPDHGDTGVNPALTEIRVEFDQAMSTNSNSVCGGGVNFPTLTDRPRWESPTTIVIPVKLEPGHTYEISINCPASRNFRSAAGEQAEITPIYFKTAKAGATPTTPEELSREQNEKALEQLRKIIDERYSYRNRVIKDWDAFFSDLRLEAAPAPTKATFARTVARALAAANDPHMSLRVGEGFFSTTRPTFEYNSDYKRTQMLVPGLKRNGQFATGQFEDGTAYIGIFSWPADRASLDAAIEAIRKWSKAPAIIVDVRFNTGGDEVTARKVAAEFVAKKSVYSRNRFRDPSKPEGWTPMMVRSIEPAQGSTPYAGKVAVLIGPACMSSNESFILMMKNGANATLVGDKTFGSSGNPKPFDLGNGVTVLVPNWEDCLPDGTPLEGKGISPDIKADFGTEGTKDGVLEAGLAAVRAK